MKRKFFAIFTILAVAVSTAACGSQTQSSSTSTGSSQEQQDTTSQITFKVSHPRPTDSDNDILTKQFCSEVQQALGEERFAYEIYPNSELGDYTIVQEAISMGEVDMAMQSVSTNVDQSLTIATAPYLIETWDQARDIYNSTDGIISVYVGEQLEKQNIKLLAMIPKYFNAVCTSKEPKDVYNLTGDKELKMRVPQMKSYELVAETLGYQVTPMAFSEVFTSMQTGIIDGCFGGGAESFYSSLKDVTKYLLLYKNAFEPHWLMMNLDDWNKFTPEEQEKIMEIAKNLESQAFDEAIANENKYVDLLEESGTTIIEFSDEQISEIADTVRKEVWPELEDVFGKELFDKVKSEIGYTE